MRRFLPLLALLGWGVAGCPGFGSPVEAIDTVPTWDDGIAALLATECAICHTAPPQSGAPTSFRLDKYDRSEGDAQIAGAFEHRERIQARAVVERSMPLGGMLTEEEINLLDEWITRGAPKSLPEGAP